MCIDIFLTLYTKYIKPFCVDFYCKSTDTLTSLLSIYRAMYKKPKLYRLEHALFAMLTSSLPLNCQPCTI